MEYTVHGNKHGWGDLFIEIKLGFAGWINVFFCSTGGGERVNQEIWYVCYNEGLDNISKTIRSSEHKDTQGPNSKTPEKSPHMTTTSSIGALRRLSKLCRCTTQAVTRDHLLVDNVYPLSFSKPFHLSVTCS